MYESMVTSKLNRYLNTYKIETELANCMENMRIITHGDYREKMPLLFNGVLKKKKHSGKRVGNTMFTMIIKGTDKTVKIDNITPVNILERNIKLRELVFYVLVKNLKDKYTCNGQKRNIMLCSEDFLIQEAMLANGFVIHKKRHEDYSTTKYIGLYNTKT
jgi:hypothetical protein